MNLQALRRKSEPALRRVFHLYWRFARGMTLGVRGLVLDGDNRVFPRPCPLNRLGLVEVDCPWATRGVTVYASSDDAV